MYGAVPTKYLESLNEAKTATSTTVPTTEETTETTPSKPPKSATSIKTKASSNKSKNLLLHQQQQLKERNVPNFTEREKTDLTILLINKNDSNAKLNLKSQNYKVLVANEHVNSELCQIL